MRLVRNAIIALLICDCSPARGDFSVAPGSVQVESVFATASLVCNCVANAIVDHAYPIEIRGRASTRHEVTAQVTIRDVYKSDDLRVTNITVQYVVDEQQGRRAAGSRFGLSKGQTVLLFLSKTGTDTYEFADPFIGGTEFSCLPNEGGDLGPMKLQHVLTSVAQSGVSLDQLQALQLLLGFDHISDETLSVVRPLSQSGNADIALTALGVLLRTKSVDSVQKLQQYLESYTANAEPSALFVIGPELREVSNPKALPALETLSASRFRSVRSGAMDGIRRMKDPKSVPFLIAKLGDADSDVQYVALITVAEILGKYEDDFAPSMYLFERRPQYYIGLWKQWWAEEGSRLYPSDSARATHAAPYPLAGHLSDNPPMPMSGLTAARQSSGELLRHRNCPAVDQISQRPADQKYLEKGDTLLWYVRSSEDLVFGLNPA